MTVSVIIPNYNHSKYLKQRIESILNQTYTDYELIILDDCSTDNSRDIIHDFKTKSPGIRTYYNESNSGNVFEQWNYGVSKSKGEYIWIAESDDYAESDFLEKTVNVLNQHQNTGLVFSDSIIINEEKGKEYLASERRAMFSNERLTKMFNNSNDNRKSISVFFENPIVNVSSVLFRKSAYVEAGGADILMRFCGDWLLYIKIFLLSYIRYIPVPLNNFRLHSESSYQSHYRSNIFLKEKMKILYFIFRKSQIGVLTIFLYLKNLFKVLILRLLFLFRINKMIKIEIPRKPSNVSELINS